MCLFGAIVICLIDYGIKSFFNDLFKTFLTVSGNKFTKQTSQHGSWVRWPLGGSIVAISFTNASYGKE